MKRYVVLWTVGVGNDWHVEDTLWATQKHADMAAELFVAKRPGFTVSTSQLTITPAKSESVAA